MTGILAFFAGPFGKWAIIGLLVAAVAAFSWFKGNEHGTEKLNTYVAKQAAESTRIAGVRSVITERVVMKYLTVTVPKTQLVTNTIEKEIVRYEAAKLDTCNLSVAGVVLHDSAALNAVPDAARSLDDSASGTQTAALVKTATENYATCHVTADRLRALQSWVSEQEKAK